MQIRGVVKPKKGSPKTTTRASVIAAAAVTDDGMPQVTVFVNAHDSHDMKTVVALLTLTHNEAKALAEALTLRADEAEKMAGRNW